MDQPLAASRTLLITSLLLVVMSGQAGAESSTGALAERGALPALGYKNVVIGSRTAAVTEVKLPVDAHIDLFEPDDDVQVEGPGRFIGIVLIPIPYDDLWPRQSTIIGRFADCSRRGCKSDSHFLYANGEDDLEAGRYRVYLIADGGQVRITFRLSGPSGKTTITPSGRAFADVKAPRVRHHNIASSNYVYGGATYTAETPGQRLTFIRVWTLPPLGGVMNTCTYKGERDSTDPSTCSPQSTYDDTDNEDPVVYRPSLPGARYSLSDWDQATFRGEWWHGFWFISPGLIEEARITTMYLSYGPKDWPPGDKSN